MQEYHAEPGEVVYNFLLRVQGIVNAKDFRWNGAGATHNGTSIIVYRGSLIEDLCDKWTWRRMLDRAGL